MSTRKTLLALTASAALLVPLAVPVAAPANAAPQLAKCGKIKAGIGKLSGRQKHNVLVRFNRCLKQNKANAIAFNLIKNGHYVGVRGDGDEDDSFYCANGRFESRTTTGYGTGVAEGRRWRVVNARVLKGGKILNAFIKGPEGFEVAYLRRGQRWYLGIASLGRILEPGVVKRTNAAKECRTP